MALTDFKILTPLEWDAVHAAELLTLLGSNEGGASYKRGDDLLYAHFPNGKPEYVLRRNYFKVVPATGEDWGRPIG